MACSCFIYSRASNPRFRRGPQVAWSNFNASVGFDACTLLDVGQNALTGTLPSSFGSIGTGGKVGLAIYDNLLSGSVPPSFASLSWVALAYNPLLVGALPAGVNSSKLYAWSGNLNGFYAWSAANVIGTSGLAPTYGSGYLYGTSIGLDRPLASILMDLKAAMDPAGASLTAWRGSQLQPCRPWVSGSASFQGQNSALPGYGGGWSYVSTVASASSAEYCQDVGSAPYTSPTTTTTNAALAGGIAALWLQGLSLSGSLPCELGQLKTVNSISLASNSLRGFLPPSLVSLTALSAMNLQLNQLQGSVPAAFGACTACACALACAALLGVCVLPWCSHGRRARVAQRCTHLASKPAADAHALPRGCAPLAAQQRPCAGAACSR